MEPDRPTDGPVTPHVLFVDVEASSLGPGSFPIEVGWAADDGTEGAVLIRPAPYWIEPEARLRAAWSRQSQDVHGISLDTLMRNGIHHADAARAVAAALTAPGAIPASDAPTYDRDWLLRLTRSVGLPAPPALAHVHQLQLSLFGPLTAVLPPAGDPRRGPAVQRLRDLATEVIARAEDAEERRGGVRHRALADARSHLRVWRDIRDRVQAVVREGWAP